MFYICVTALQVHKHKTSNIYGAGRVSFSCQSAEVLLKYGLCRLEQEQKLIEMHPYSAYKCKFKLAR